MFSCSGVSGTGQRAPPRTPEHRSNTEGHHRLRRPLAHPLNTVSNPPKQPNRSQGQGSAKRRFRPRVDKLQVRLRAHDDSYPKSGGSRGIPAVPTHRRGELAVGHSGATRQTGKLRRSAPAGDWDDLVVVCAGTSWDGPWMSEKHIADRLTAYAPVLFVDPPISHLTSRRSPDLAASFDESRLRLIRPGLARLTPVSLPGMERPGIRALTEALTRRALRRAVTTLGGRVRAVVIANQRVLFGACGEEVRLVYATDDFVAGASLMGVDADRLARDERRQAASADVVITVSEGLSAKWRALGHDPVLVPNGVDAAGYSGTDAAPWPSDLSLPEPIAGFIGHLSERIDVGLLESVADRGISLLLVGPRQPTFDLTRLDALFARPNVQWVGSKPFAELPSYLRAMRVGLTPYRDTAFNQASFPLKTLEYLAAGRPVVASDLPAARWLGAGFVTTASGPTAFADAVADVLHRPLDSVDTRRRQAFAAAHGWDVRTQSFANALGMAGKTEPVGTGILRPVASQ